MFFFSLTNIGLTQGVLETVGMDILCYVVLLLMPVLARMSDQVAEVRLMASRCFATLVSLMPLEVLRNIICVYQNNIIKYTCTCFFVLWYISTSSIQLIIKILF